MRFLDAEKLCSGKLSMNKKQRKRHVQYVLTDKNSESIPLPKTVAVPRTSKKLQKNDIASIAEIFGMSLKEIERASKCEISEPACLLGMMSSILKKARIEIENDPITNDWDSTSLNYIPLLVERFEVSMGSTVKEVQPIELEFLHKLKEENNYFDRCRGSFKTYGQKFSKILSEFILIRS